MFTYENETTNLAGWIKTELYNGVSDNNLQISGHEGQAVRRIQEWLCLRRLFQVVVDGIYGPATEKAVKDFQEWLNLPVTGNVDANTFAQLIQPMRTILKVDHKLSTLTSSLNEAILTYANKHFLQTPREVGGDNRGPWVRLYMHGKDGDSYPWCAGFVSFILAQAAETLAIQTPIEGSVSCNILAYQAEKAGLLVKGEDLRGKPIPPGSFFLVRHAATTPRPNWIHTGIVQQSYGNTFQTIEGNADNFGSQRGHEVCSRVRVCDRYDFILFGGVTGT